MTLRADILDDLNTIFDPTDLAEAATLAGGAVVYGIVNEVFDNSSNIENFFMSFTCKASDVSALVHGSTLSISSVTYYVIAKEPDRNGWTVLRLSKDQ